MTKPENKVPREFWISEDLEEIMYEANGQRYAAGWAYAENPTHESDPVIRVVEASAYDALQYQLDEKTAQVDGNRKLYEEYNKSLIDDVEIRNRHIAKLRAELEAAKAEIKDLRWFESRITKYVMPGLSDSQDSALAVFSELEAENKSLKETCDRHIDARMKANEENKRLREALEQATIIDDAKWQHSNRGQMGIALHGVSNAIVRALKQEGEG